MTLSTENKKGLIKEKPLMDLLNTKVELRKELILLKKLHESKERQLELLEKIEEITIYKIYLMRSMKKI